MKKLILKLQDKFENWLIKDMTINFTLEWNNDYF